MIFLILFLVKTSEMIKELFPYQARSKNLLRESVKRGNKRIIWYAPTGAGKSILAVDLINSLKNNGKRVAFIANRIGLVKQFSDHLTDAGINHGIVRGEDTFNIGAQVIVCSIQTLARKGAPAIDYAIIDEAHGAISQSYRDLIFSLNNIHWIGLTATPFSRGLAKVYPELGNEPLFQDIVITATIQELIELGNLVDCDIYAPSEPDLKGVKLQRNQFGEMDYNEKQLGAAVDNQSLVGDIVQHWIKLANGKKTVVFATNVAHSRHIVEEFKNNFIKAEHIDGYMSPEEKQPILDRFKSGETQIISNVAMLQEGWDVPECECMILAKPTRSLVTWIQMAGRVLRRFQGKLRAIILDHSGTVHRLGYPTDDLPLELCDGTSKKTDKSDSKEVPKKEKKCPQCHLIKKTHKCPNCGFEPVQVNEVEVADGELSKAEKKKVFKGDKQQIWSECLGMGKSPGAAAHLYKSITGVWPRKLNDIPLHPSDYVKGCDKRNMIAYLAGKKKDANANR